jgi:DnaJ-class molecular chaperone
MPVKKTNPDPDRLIQCNTCSGSGREEAGTMNPLGTGLSRICIRCGGTGFVPRQDRMPGPPEVGQ